MPLIKLNVKINQKDKKIKLNNVLYDSGSNISLINHKIIKKLKIKSFKDHMIFKSMGGINNVCKNRAMLNLKINKLSDKLNVCVYENGSFTYDMILGLDAIQKFKLIQDDNLRISQRLKNGKIEFISELCPLAHQCSVNFNEFINTDEFTGKLDHLDSTKSKVLEKLINRYGHIFAKNKYDIGQVSNHEAQIKLKEYKYIAKKPYRCSIPDQIEIESQISKLLENGLIEESCSPFSAPVTLVYKKEDGRRSRLCIDFRELNKLVIPEAAPFPRIEDITVKAGNSKFFSAFDINSAFWSIPLREKDRMKTAFVTQNGHFQFRVLPFGLKNSPAIFQRILTNIIRRHNLSRFCVHCW